MNEKKTKDSKSVESSNSFLFGFFVNYFKPSAYISSISDISLKKLKEQGIKMIICDLDNTLVPHYTKFPSKNAINFVNEVKKLNLIFVIISNNTKNRVRFFAEKLKLDDYIYNAKKPYTKYVKKILKKYEISTDEALIIGDMIVTDILLANILHIESILVTPIIDYGNTISRSLKFLEKYAFLRLSRNNLITSDNILNKKDFYEEYDLL
ncbi:MAG: hypothetical protein HPAVJP_2690 [Candidatus Hepatoplasma vulgare]|nr:MAG: hypothetical protein HPAVJP_2690 [Candidatus Hepatoplasma sp.]